MIHIFDLDGTLYDKKGLKKRMVLRSIIERKPVCMLLCERSCRAEISGIDTGTVGYNTLFEHMFKRSHKSVDRWI